MTLVLRDIGELTSSAKLTVQNRMKVRKKKSDKRPYLKQLIIMEYSR